MVHLHRQRRPAVPLDQRRQEAVHVVEHREFQHRRAQDQLQAAARVRRRVASLLPSSTWTTSNSPPALKRSMDLREERQDVLRFVADGDDDGEMHLENRDSYERLTNANSGPYFFPSASRSAEMY